MPTQQIREGNCVDSYLLHTKKQRYAFSFKS